MEISEDPMAISSRSSKFIEIKKEHATGTMCAATSMTVLDREGYRRRIAAERRHS